MAKVTSIKTIKCRIPSLECESTLSCWRIFSSKLSKHVLTGYEHLDSEQRQILKCPYQTWSQSTRIPQCDLSSRSVFVPNILLNLFRKECSLCCEMFSLPGRKFIWIIAQKLVHSFLEDRQRLENPCRWQQNMKNCQDF